MTNQEAIEFLKNMIDREAIGFVCPEREGDVAIWQYHVEALQMAISALESQEAKAQLSEEGTTSDLISRQDAIEVIEEMQMPIMRSMFPEEQFVFKGMSEALSAIKDLPSAQPESEERKAESAQNVPKEDLISRKAAINAMGKAQWAKERLMELPSVQPKSKWIPVSERMPEEDNWLGGSGKQFSDNVLVSILNSDDEDEWVDISQTIDGEWGIELPRHCKITAWMPLPKPYKAERRTDDANDIT